MVAKGKTHKAPKPLKNPNQGSFAIVGFKCLGIDVIDMVIAAGKHRNNGTTTYWSNDSIANLGRKLNGSEKNRP